MIQTNKLPASGKSTLRFGEFVALTASMIALVALSTDTMLPALSTIGQELGARQANDNQLIISLLFLGMAIGQIIYGPLSDSTGRKPAIYLGFVNFILGCLLAIFAPTFQVMLIGRFLQGMGVAGPRSVATALVRDQYEGRGMARVMSFVMAVFILVPIIAPSIGQAILLLVNWRGIFVLFLVLALIVSAWFAIRQPETLPLERRIPFTVTRLRHAFTEVLTNRITFGYTITAGFVSGAFVGYLNSAQQIFQLTYGLGERFPLYFAMLALGSGTASYLNGRFVLQYGMRNLSHRALLVYTILSILTFLFSLTQGGLPPLWFVTIYFIIIFFTIGMLFGNLNALAMEPLGHIAGVGAAVVGSLSTLISTILGTIVGQNFNGTILPLVGGFALLGLLSLAVTRWAEAGHK
ncbi:MAG: multidrug effflux MFS transporter [Anaerolineales bacterium]|nr:multidrug effflux MFS transporter [Anaerolineales bacterium]